ncbi:hypothetical protein ERIC1_1c04610 [Paenibacillus larvae subsp. larvae DSM 25719]|uniref:Uncharacterized protein n=1 Tax=Paenibacillus larvae subsp. larvae DSM 25430 TaxID=697284 RepID=V9W6K2_9BACL|nr:hypothetical protein ERIC2_c17700 [Paenibacillus larvae subsp. larvae DSM 25430]ETK27023.1 hypothetical protein ERIC1_1c04610 [Paenibacillus larvae subsp. larvae DSM 25719]
MPLCYKDYQTAKPGKQEVPFRSIMDWILLAEKDCPDPVSLVVELTREGVRRAQLFTY